MSVQSGSHRGRKSRASDVVSTRTPTVSRRRPGLWSWFGAVSERVQVPHKTKSRKNGPVPKVKPAPKIATLKIEAARDLDPAPRIDLPKELATKKARSSLIGAYFKAVIVGFASSLAFVGFLSGVGGGLGDFKVMQYIAGAMVSLTMAPVLAVPAYVLSQIAAQMTIPRGYSDVLIGGILGSIMFVSDGGFAQQIAFVFGGMVGGFAFWRARGCPGASTATANALDAAFRGVR